MNSVAKRRKAKTKSGAVTGALGRGVAATWRFIARSLGKSVRFVARGARDLDPAHQRDGIAFLILIAALIAAAGAWFQSDNLLGRAISSVFYGGFGRIGFVAPLILVYFAIRLFRVPEDTKATGRIIIGALTLLLSSTGLADLFIVSTKTRERGGWLGNGVTKPLDWLMTPELTKIVLIIVLIFGVLVITATPVSKVFTRISSVSKWAWSKRPEREEKVEEEFEITDTPAFDTPIIAGLSDEEDEEEEELDEESFDE